jgi:hypothetical protein
MSGASAGAAAAAAARIAAIKASGLIVRVKPHDFLTIVRRQQDALVVHAIGGFFNSGHHYLTSYKGLAFHTRASDPLDLPSGTELIQAESIWVPQ